MNNLKSITDFLSIIILTLLMSTSQIFGMQSLEEIELIQKVNGFINCGVKQNYRPLIDAFFQSTEIGSLEVAEKILNYGIDIDMTLIEAIERGDIIAIQKLFSCEPSLLIIDHLTYILADDNQNDSLKICIQKLLNGESISTNKIANLKSEWSQKVAKTLKDSFFVS